MLHIPSPTKPRLTVLSLALLCWLLGGASLGAEEAPPACHTPASEEASPSAATAAATAADPGLATQVRIPDVALFDQHGKAVDFYSDLIAGQVVAMNFVFTTCTTICPPMGATFGKLERLLDESGSEAKLISVTVDPAVDTPARLEAWGEKFGAGDRWTLVTGAVPEVNRLLKALGVFSPEKTDHSPVALIGNARTGEWLRTSGFTPPAKLAAELERMVEGSPDQLASAEAGR